MALLTTAFLASILAPPRRVTPTARPPSTRMSSTCDRSSSPPPFFSSPRTRPSTIASLPPTGNSSVLFGRYQSSNMYPISAASVPLAGAPLSRKHRTSIQLRMNGCLNSFASRNLLYGAMICGSAARLKQAGRTARA